MGWFRMAARLPTGIVAAALTVRLVDEWWSYLPSGVIENLRRDVGVSYGQAGTLLTLLVVAGIIGGPLGALSDHVSRRLVAVSGGLLLCAGLVAYAVTSSFPVLVVASIALGIASDLIIRPLESSMAEDADEALDRLIGRQHLFTFLGDIGGPALLAVGVGTTLGWRFAFWATAALIGAYTIFLATLSFPPPSAPAETLGDAIADFGTIARRRDVQLLALAEVCLFPLDEPILGFAIARLSADGLGWPVQGLALSYVLAGLAGSLLVERRGLTPRSAIAGGFWLVAGSAVVAVGSFIGVALVGFLMIGWGMSLAWAWVHHRQLTVVAERSATVSSVISVVAGVGAFAPVLAGVVADRTSLGWGISVFLVFACVLVLALRADTAMARQNSGHPALGD